MLGRDRSDQGPRWRRSRWQALVEGSSGFGIRRGITVTLVALAALLAGAGLWWVATVGDDAPGPTTQAPSIGPRVVGTDLKRKLVYHSPQTPGYTAWTGVWTAPDGALMTAFTQATGPIPSTPHRDWGRLEVSQIILRSTDGGRTWQQFYKEDVPGPPHAYTGQAVTGLRDGTILRRVNGEDLKGFADVPGTAYLQRLEPGAKDWTKPSFLLDPKKFTYNLSRIQYLSDGRLLATGNYWDVPAGERDPDVPLPPEKRGWLLMTSEDEGLTWTDALTVPPESEVPPNEWDVAELPGGDLLAVMRTSDPADPSTQLRKQALLQRDGDGWTMGKPTSAPFPHSGHPELLATREGVVLHIATTGTDYTRDGGRTWDPLRFTGTSGALESAYYPVSTQAKDGEIYVLSHIGGDDDFGERDQAIVIDRFGLETRGGER